MNILFVCTGNTCRSPMAAALLCHHLEHRESSLKEPVRVSSAGIAASDGREATPEAIEVMDSYGVDLRGHRATCLTAAAVQGADLILTMTESHARSIALCFGTAAKGKVYPLKAYLGRTGNIPDPIGLGKAAYEKCAAELNTLTEELATSLAS